MSPHYTYMYVSVAVLGTEVGSTTCYNSFDFWADKNAQRLQAKFQLKLGTVLWKILKYGNVSAVCKNSALTTMTSSIPSDVCARAFVCLCVYNRALFLWCLFFYRFTQKDMATQWSSWRIFEQRYPRQRWRVICWLWSNSGVRGWGCTGPWCGLAGLWSAWRQARCHLWTPPLHRGSCCVPSLRVPPLVPKAQERHLQTEPFCRKPTEKREKG